MAALASPPRKTPGAWDDNDLAEDIATLSYESALRAHARYRSGAPTDQSLTQAADSGAFFNEEVARAAAPAAPRSQPMEAEKPETAPALEREPSRPRSAQFERNLKDASITIRLSKAECAQLHQRAAEAGLTVSAYLRSCTFEAESLRAMVKDTLSQLRTPAAQALPAPPRRLWLRALTGWIVRMLNPWHGSQRVARA